MRLPRYLLTRDLTAIWGHWSEFRYISLASSILAKLTEKLFVQDVRALMAPKAPPLAVATAVSRLGTPSVRSNAVKDSKHAAPKESSRAEKSGKDKPVAKKGLKKKTKTTKLSEKGVVPAADDDLAALEEDLAEEEFATDTVEYDGDRYRRDTTDDAEPSGGLPMVEAPAAAAPVESVNTVVTEAVLTDVSAPAAAADSDETALLKARVDALFESMDTDGSGEISRKELAAKLRADGQIESLLGIADASTVPEVVHVMRILDKMGTDQDGDTYITREELQTMHSYITPKITREELVAGLLADREVAVKLAAERVEAARRHILQEQYAATVVQSAARGHVTRAGLGRRKANVPELTTFVAKFAHDMVAEMLERAFVKVTGLGGMDEAKAAAAAAEDPAAEEPVAVPAPEGPASEEPAETEPAPAGTVPVELVAEAEAADTPAATAEVVEEPPEQNVELS